MVLLRKIKTFIRLQKESWYRKELRKKLSNKDFTLISNNCWGGGIYEDLGLPYTTPTVGLFFHGPCYLSFLEGLKFYLQETIVFIAESKYEIANSKRQDNQDFYPIGLLGDIEIHFLHYHSKEEALEKWNRRKVRINFDNIFVELGQNELVDYKLMKRFDNLPYKNKLLFSGQNHEDLKSLVWLKYRQDFEDVGDLYTDRNVWRPEFNVVEWLNEGEIK